MTKRELVIVVVIVMGVALFVLAIPPAVYYFEEWSNYWMPR